MRIYQRMPAFEGVNAGVTANAKLPIGRQFHYLDLVYSGVTLAQMTEIRVLANGTPIHRYSATERDTMNQYLGLDAAAGILRIPFDRLNLRIKEGEAETALNTAPNGNGLAVNSLTVEIDIDAAAAAPALQLYAEQSQGQEGVGPGTILYVQKHTRSAAGAGEFEISDLFNLPSGGADSQALVRASFFTPNDRIDKIKVERGLYTVFERTTALNEYAQKNGGGERVPQAGCWVVDTTDRGYAGEPVQIAGFSDFRYILTMSAAEDMRIIQETLGFLGG